MRKIKAVKRVSKTGLTLTSVFMLPDVFTQYQAQCRAAGSTASVRLREFVSREVRKANRAGALGE
jgi:hypothetical protein